VAMVAADFDVMGFTMLYGLVMTHCTITPTQGAQIKPSKLLTFHLALQHWYRAHGRHDLPWRNTPDPYAIWVSEIMLQQTQVVTVRDRYYAPFLQKFPTVDALAAAPREAVLKAWEGLGYYRRAGHLHEAAKKIVAGGGWRVTGTRPAIFNLPLEGGGRKRQRAGGGDCTGGSEDRLHSLFHHPHPNHQPHPNPPPSRGRERATHASRTTYHAIPNSLELLLALPGIGRNTAHAILAFAYRQPVAVMEANVKRVVTRIFGLAQPKENELWAGAETLMGLPMRLSEPSSRSTRAQGGRVAALRNRTEHGRDKEIGQRNAWMNCFHYNQAMMDLGALICTPKAPRCGECPAASICKGKSRPTHYPQAKTKKKIPTRRVVILVREDNKGRLYLEKRDTKLLGGLYGFPQHPPEYQGGESIGRLRHVYSHFRLEAEVRHEHVRGSNSADWHSHAALSRLPLSRLDRNVLKLHQPARVTLAKPRPAQGAVDAEATED